MKRECRVIFGTVLRCLKTYIPVFWIILIVTGVFVFLEYHFANSFQHCITYEATRNTYDNFEIQNHLVAIVINSNIICSLRLVDAHNGFFAGNCSPG
jgi:hypothetical protein